MSRTHCTTPALLLCVAIACAPVRPAPGALVPMHARLTNEIRDADLATLDAWEIKRAALLRNDGADLSTRPIILARAAAWLVVARDAYVAHPLTQDADDALAEARRLMESLSDGTTVASGASVPTAPSATALVSLAGGVRLTPPEELRRTARTVHFALASDELAASSVSLLDGVASAMREHPELSLEVGGHADPRGEDMGNLWLSGRRADGVRDLLVGSGVDENRVVVRMFGARQRDASGTTVRDYARDRRVQLKFVLPDGSELPVAEDAVDLQIEQQRLWFGALRPGLRRFVAAPGSTVVARPRPLRSAKATRKVTK